MQQELSGSDIPPPVEESHDAMASSKIPRSIARVFDLLEIVLSQENCTLTDAATSAELTPTTTLRYLRAMESRGYLQRSESGVFSVGPTLQRLAATVNEHGPTERLLAAAQPRLDQLARDAGESCYLALADRQGATYVAAAESSRTIRHVGWVGQTVPLDGTALGAALSNPGVMAVRSGRVEPDITAVSLALPPFASLRATISVVGPTQRMTTGSRQTVSRALEAAVSALAADLGVEHPDRNEAAS